MRVTVKLFAGARHTAGADAIQVELTEEATVGTLRVALADQHPQLASLVARSLLAVGEEYAGEETPLKADAEIALIPPVSGG
jgi:molybdopterin synthase catalytic subunit